MNEKLVKREYYWIVEACDNNGRINFRKEYHDKEGLALKEYARLRSTGTVSIQRKFKEQKVA